MNLGPDVADVFGALQAQTVRIASDVEVTHLANRLRLIWAQKERKFEVRVWTRKYKLQVRQLPLLLSHDPEPFQTVSLFVDRGAIADPHNSHLIAEGPDRFRMIHLIANQRA